MAYFPMMTDLGGKSVLVIGGGDEGAKKIHILHSFGARITLIAINACEEAVAECDEYIEGPFSEDLSPAYLKRQRAYGDQGAGEAGEAEKGEGGEAAFISIIIVAWVTDICYNGAVKWFVL